jgi:hypothetical protein
MKTDKLYCLALSIGAQKVVYPYYANAITELLSFAEVLTIKRKDIPNSLFVRAKLTSGGCVSVGLFSTYEESLTKDTFTFYEYDVVELEAITTWQGWDDSFLADYREAEEDD